MAFHGKPLKKSLRGLYVEPAVMTPLEKDISFEELNHPVKMEVSWISTKNHRERGVLQALKSSRNDSAGERYWWMCKYV